MSDFEPTPEQAAVITHPPTPLLVVAGAGTGKTTAVAERIVHLVRSGTCTADEVLGLTFSNKAAAHLRHEVAARLGHDADVTVSTYHSFGARLVAAHCVQLGLHPRHQVLNRAQAWQLLFNVFDEFEFEARRTFRPGSLVNDALELASRCADHLVDVEAVRADCDDLATAKWKGAPHTAQSRRELCQVISRYQERKRERNLVDYDDQIVLAVRLLEECPEVAAALRQQHPVVLLDEYQDTNYAQRVMLRHIYGPGAAVTAVGDDMQSIYGFRGAHLGNILGFPGHFPPVEQRPLQLNRRSGAALVMLANRIQAEVAEALPKALEALPGAPPTGIECFLAADGEREAQAIARDVRARGGAWRESAVLCRKRRLIAPIAAALEAEGVPVDVVGAGGLLDRPEIVDLVAWLEVLADVGDTVALLRLLEGPRYRIGRRDLAALARHQRDRPMGDALADLDAVEGLSAAARARLARFDAERAALSSAAGRVSVLDLAETVILRTGLWRDAGDKGRENLLRFLDLAERFAPIDGDPGLRAFVEYVRLLDESEEELSEARLGDLDAVRVMTVHQAKGLEFDHVWVPGLAKGIFPDPRTLANAVTNSTGLPWWLRGEPTPGLPHWRDAPSLAAINEELKRQARADEWRLFYVACTRARRSLVLSAAHWYAGPSKPQGPGDFYDFVVAQTDLVAELYRDDAAAGDPAVAAKERRRAALAARYAAAPVAADPPATLFDEEAQPPATAAPARRAPVALSVTSLVSYARCPLQFYWSVVRPLPRRPSPAAALGTEVHRWIEKRADRQLVLLEPEPDGGADPGDDATGGVRGGPGRVEALRRSFLDSPYAAIDPQRVEAPFQLVAGGRTVRGRIDAVYRRDDRLELVDFKTGTPHLHDDPGAPVQLDLYALAAVDTWRAEPAELRTTYCWLRHDGPPRLDSVDWDGDRLHDVRHRLDGTLERLGAGQFGPTPGAWCSRCEFLPFCRTGRAHTGG